MSLQESERTLDNNQEPTVERRGPFEVIERKIIHDRFGMQLVGDRVVRPDGTIGEQFWVNFTREGVLIFPVDDQGNIYLSEEYTYGTDQYTTEAVGGSVDEGEDPRDAAIREVKEELGIDVSEVHSLGTYHQLTSRVNSTTHVFLARVRSVGEAKPESGEVIRLRKMPFGVAFEMVENGVINTAIIAAALWKIRNILETTDSLQGNSESV